MELDNTEERLMVSIFMVTYNHEKYIKQAIEGVINQVTNFKIKLFIGEDFSSDNTRNICIYYQNKYPDKICLIIRDENIGAEKNGKEIHDLCLKSGSKYIALCDGDDYWSDLFKLQKQVDFLEANLDYVICFHHIYELVNDKKLRLSSFYPSNNQETYTLEDLAKGNFINTPSVVFRNGLLNQLPDWFKETPIGDYVLHMLNAQYGKIKYFSEPMAVYRIHDTNIWGGKNPKFQCQNMFKVVNNLISYYQNSPQVVLNLKHQAASLKSQIAEIFLDEGNKDEYLKNLKEAFSISPSFMDEWLINANAKHKKLAQSMEYKIGWTIRNPRVLLRKFTSLVKPGK